MSSNTTSTTSPVNVSNKLWFPQEDGLPEDLNYDSMAEAMTKQFEETFSALLNDPTLKQQFENLAGSAEQAGWVIIPLFIMFLFCLNLLILF